MKEIGRIILPILLATTVMLGLTPQTLANNAATATLTLEPTVISVVPCSTFKVEVWVRDIPDGYGVIAGQAMIQWTPSLMEPMMDEVIINLPETWEFDGDYSPDGWAVGMAYAGNPPGDAIFEDQMVVSITFHCLKEGVATIDLDPPPDATWWLTLMPKGGGGKIPVGGGFDSVEVHQVPPRVPPSYSTPVGGILTSANKLVVLAPYLALMGLVGAVSTVYALKRRRSV
ncbi:MAG: hypothetical protein QW542_07970 [Thermoproteota archaeon]